METMRYQGLNFAVTWNLFLFRMQVGCYCLADALRLKHAKFTHCLELSRKRRGTKEQDEEKKDAQIFFSLQRTWSLSV